jgi:co-chaperonin GroES (HSP10)
MIEKGEILDLNGRVINRPKIAAVETPPDNAEARAKQLPDPATYHILCLVPEVSNQFDSGLYKSDKTVFNEEVLTPVLFVAKVGPDAFADPKRFPSGPSCKVGDFVLVRPNSGTRFKVHGLECRLISDESIEAVVEDPRAIQRCFL